MFRAQNATVLNYLANHPDILPTTIPRGQTQTAPIAFDICFAPEHRDRFRGYHNGANDDDLNATISLCFAWSGPDMWEFHVSATREGRGATALQFARECLADMYFKQGAEIIWGQPPVWSKPVRYFARKVGGISRGFGTNRAFGAVEYFRTSREEWTGPNSALR